MDLFTAPFAPFTIALLILLVLVLIEIAGLAFGVAFSGLVDGLLPEIDADADVDLSGGDAIGKLFAWLYVGKVPVLIVLAAFLAGFGLVGVTLQNVAAATFGASLPLFMAAPLAFLGAIPTTRVFAGLAARIIPKEESDAVSADSFVGRVATIIRGEARIGAPAEARLIDAHGLTHYILIEPDEAGAAFRQGEEILVIENSGAVMRGAPAQSALLASKSE